MQHVNPDKLLHNFCDQRLSFEFKMKTKALKVQFYSATTKKMESAAYSRLALYKYPQYTSCKKFRQCRNK